MSSKGNSSDNGSSYRKAASFMLKTLTAEKKQKPIIGIICGSGLSGLSSCMTNTVTISYSSIPCFPAETTVAGHKNECVIGNLEGIPAICFRGRFHFYEGHDMNTVVLPVRMMRAIGVKVVFVTNAAGGLNPLYNVGDIVSIVDHFSLPMLTGNNPFMGPNDMELGPRFPPMSNAYDENLQALAMASAERLGLENKVRANGVYCFASGPAYESKTEGRFLRSVGGDAVGMSTIPEIAAAHHSGMKVLCLSVITNKVVVTEGEAPANHQEVLDAVNECAQHIQALITDIIASSGAYVQSLPDLPILTSYEEEESINKRVAAAADNNPCHRSVKICGIPIHCMLMGTSIITIGAAVAVSILLRLRKK